MSMTIDDAAGILKQRYPAMKLQYIGYQDNPFLALVPKDPTFTGKVYDLPIWYGGNQGGSHVFAKAQANKTGGLYGQFLLTRIKDYALTSVPTEAVLASMDDVGSFLKLSTAEVDNTIRMASNNLDKELFGNSGGARGKIASVSTTSLTLSDINTVVNFEVGMKVTSATTDGTSGSDDAEAIAITGVNRSTGVLTAAVTWTAGGHFANNSYLFREGDFGVALSGLDTWLNTSGTLFGQVRSSESRLLGIAHDGSSQSLEEALLNADIKVAREGGKLSHFFLNHADFNNLRLSLGSKVIYDKVRSPDMASVGFRSIVITGVNGDINVVAERHCPKGTSFGLQMDSWKLASLGPCPRFLTAMGQGETIWDYNADSVEFRSGYYAQLGCHAPIFNTIVTLPSG